jgi:hypothetical protein
MKLHRTPRPVALVHCFGSGPFFSEVATAFYAILDFTAGRSSLKIKYCIPGIYKTEANCFPDSHHEFVH